ncbi:presqualene diphosphate synthase HpnD [Methylocapsa acidiphila]|uniref:presqualene diphosphate synthase HpnD n=1 Tax=Methylocapsa acidiphila TaxID=133552 RepID=UPI0004013FC6|nr:presqualene diphosphate synthase HpnD [Methylocapsa acidiphila]
MSAETSAAADGEDAAVRSRGSSFYAAMRILPRPRREAMFEIYSFCRAVDDIADEGGQPAARLDALEAWRRDIGALCGGRTPSRPLLGLQTAIEQFDLRREDFLAVIDGMEMDVLSDIQAPSFATLDLYCDRVASAVGRLSVRIFGAPPAEGRELAHHLGRAFQLTNILRDLDEDAAIGRLYLPREQLLAAGIFTTAPNEVLASPALGKACAPLIDIAAEHFAQGRRIMAGLPRATVRAPRVMAEVYQSILAGLAARGFAPPRLRQRTPRHRILLAILRYGLI